MKQSESLNKWNEFLGDGSYSDTHPRTGVSDPDRIVSADGQRSIRFGNHEMSSSVNKLHYHEETWIYDPENNVMNVNNTLVRVITEKQEN